MNSQDKENPENWDHSTSKEFLDYYSEQSATQEMVARADRARDMILRVRGTAEGDAPLDVLDIGCNAGTFSISWAEKGHRVTGVDISAELIELARRRANDAGADIEFKVGSATELPIESGSMDVCFSPELLEHVADWESCLDEFTRVLRPGGTLYLTTTNKLCPVQMEFNLPLYSWYPGRLKRHFEKLSVTTKPELANHATYPAVNWFSFYMLRKELARRGLSSKDRFDVMLVDSQAKKIVVSLVQRFAPVRWVAQVMTPSSIVVGTKHSG